MRKKIIFYAWLCVSFLFFSSWTLAEEAGLKLLLSEEENGKTGFEIETTRPVAYQRFNVENPRGLVVDFLENGIYSSFDKEIVFEDGPIEEIRTFFLDERGAVDSLFFKLRDEFVISVKEDDAGLTLNLDEGIKQGNAADKPRKEAETASALNFSRQKAQEVQKTAKDFILVPQGNKEIRLPSSSVPEVETALVGAKVLSKGEPDCQPSAKNLTSAEKPLAARSVKKFCSLLKFTPVFAYLAGSLFLIGTMSFWYTLRNSSRGDKLFVSQKRSGGRKTAGMEENMKMKPKAVRKRRKFHRLEMRDVSVSRKPKIKIETTDEIKANYNCRLKNLGLGGLCFEVHPHINLNFALAKFARRAGRLNPFGFNRARRGNPERISIAKFGINVPLIIQLELELPGKQLIEVCARVAWQRSAASDRRLYGANFLAIDYEARENLRSYLEHTRPN